MYFAGSGIKLLVSAEAEETTHEGTSPTASKHFWTLAALCVLLLYLLQYSN